MTKLIIADIVALMVIGPLMVIAANKSDDKWKYLLLFVSFYFIYTCLLFLPILVPALKIIESTWNWSGKVYATIGSLLFYIIFKKAFAKHDYITFKQNNNSLKPKFYTIIFIFIVTAGTAFFLTGKSEERLEYFLFQFTMPGLDEELAFRGIMLGLLSNVLKPKINFGPVNLGSPALLITSILFGLVHSFGIDNNWDFHQNWFEFINTFAIGWVLGWMTIKSGSILLPILTHNLINTLPKIIFFSVCNF